MPYLMRIVRSGRWLPPDWLPPGEPPADILEDLQTRGTNALSLWLIEEDRSNLERVAAALASGRDSFSNLDYRLVPTGWLTRYRIVAAATPGKTADTEANDRWHRDLSHLTANRLVSVARCMWRRDAPGRLSEKRVKQLLSDGIQSGQLRTEQINPNLAAKLNAAH